MIESVQPLHHTSRHVTHRHRHSTGQLYWVTRGMVMVEAEHLKWALTPGAVGWFPPDTPHSAWMPVDAQGAALHLKAPCCDLLPSSPCIRAASQFLLLLLQKIADQAASHDNAERLQRLLLVMVDEIQLADAAMSHIVMPEDARAKRVAQAVLANVGDQRAQVELANQAGLSVRTLSRLFIQQTGLTFSQWRQKAKVIAALEHLQRGESVSQVALLSGYENVSAFIAVFRRFMGMTPGHFHSITFSP